MLSSIDKYMAVSGLSETQINGSKKLPDLLSMINEFKENGKLYYVVGQKIGSHHVHGTFSSLLLHYLDHDENTNSFYPRDHSCETHVNQYIFIPRIVLSSMGVFIKFIFSLQETIDNFINIFNSIEEGILEIRDEINKWGSLRNQSQSNNTSS